MVTASTPQDPSAFVRRLPTGERLPLPADSVADWETFPFEGDLRVKALHPPVLPEPARQGEDGPDECRACLKPVTEALWADDHWRLDAVGTESRLPAVVMLQSRGHYDLGDLPAERAAELGPLLQRAERAVLGLDGVARVHVNRWGDGAAHLHFWLLARPAGLLHCAAPSSLCGRNSCRPCPTRSAGERIARSPPPWPRTAAPPTPSEAELSSAGQVSARGRGDGTAGPRRDGAPGSRNRKVKERGPSHGQQRVLFGLTRPVSGPPSPG